MTKEHVFVETGTVTSVYRDTERTQGIFIDAEVGPDVPRQGILLLPTMRDMWTVPHEGDEVEIYTLDSHQYVARFPQYPTIPREKRRGGDPADRPPVPEDAIQGDFLFRPDEGTELFFRRRAEGGDETYDVHIRASGDLYLETSGELIEEVGAGDTIEDREYYPENREQSNFEPRYPGAYSGSN